MEISPDGHGFLRATLEYHYGIIGVVAGRAVTGKGRWFGLKCPRRG